MYMYRYDGGRPRPSADVFLFGRVIDTIVTGQDLRRIPFIESVMGALL